MSLIHYVFVALHSSSLFLLYFHRFYCCYLTFSLLHAPYLQYWFVLPLESVTMLQCLRKCDIIIIIIIILYNNN